MDEEEIETAVIAYLKKGFKQTKLTFQDEQQHLKSVSTTTTTNNSSNNNNSSSNSNSANSQTDPDIARQILLFSAELENSPAQYSEGYGKFDHGPIVLWTCTRFRNDHEMMHSRDLQKLEGVLPPSHLEQMEFAHSLRQSKVNIKICQYSYDLLLQYLHKTQSITMLGLINEDINFQVSPGQPSSISDDAEVVTIMGAGRMHPIL